MKNNRVLFAACLFAFAGCQPAVKPYGRERSLAMPANQNYSVAVAPTVNLSGERLDPLLQSDLVFHQLQAVRGLTVIPVNRVAEIYATLKIDKVQNDQQAALVCDLLGVEGLIVPTITAFDPYDPPKMGASLQWMAGGPVNKPTGVDVRELIKAMTPPPDESPEQSKSRQAVGMFDAANGSVRERLVEFATGRHEPSGPLGAREYLVNMDRYSAFVWNELIEQLITPAPNGR